MTNTARFLETHTHDKKDAHLSFDDLRRVSDDVVLRLTEAMAAAWLRREKSLFLFHFPCSYFVFADHTAHAEAEENNTVSK